VKHLSILLLLYAALVAQVSLRYGGAGSWTPNLLLLVGLGAASRLRGGIVWAASAGLACDALSGRPLGVTMLAATLAAAAARQTAVPSPCAGGIYGVFLSIAAVETAARCLAATVTAGPDYFAEALAALRVASATALVFASVRSVALAWGLLRRAGAGSPRLNFRRAAGR